MAPDPSICVLATAGAGKTRVLTLRIARRVSDGTADRRRVLVCTFSRKAASELRARLWRIGVADVCAGTLHRTALGLLAEHASLHGYPLPRIIDRRRLLASVLGTGNDHSSPAVLRLDAEIGWAKARLLPPEAYLDQAVAVGRGPKPALQAIAASYRDYETERRRRQLADLDDLLVDSGHLLASDPRFAEAIRWRHAHVFVDEFQDLNPAQFRLLRRMLDERPDVFVVGDPNQAIYGWNGADPTLLDELPERIPGTRVIRLDDNHRSSPEIVAMSNCALGPSRFPEPQSSRSSGTVPTISAHGSDDDEANWVARQIRRTGARQHWADIAVLARTNAQLARIANALARERIPSCRVGEEREPGSDVAVASDPDDGHGGSEALPPEPAPQDGVALATFHRAKGLEWPIVFVVGLREGLMPIAAARTAAALAEERRLLYVALTRARDHLSCSWSEEQGSAPCRWLQDIQAAVSEFEAARAPADPQLAAEHLAALRAALRASEPDLQPRRGAQAAASAATNALARSPNSRDPKGSNSGSRDPQGWPAAATSKSTMTGA